MLRWLLLAAALSCVSSAVKMSPDQDVVIDVNWPEFLGRADLVWDWNAQENTPNQWYQSAFHGNGALGLMAYWNSSINSFRFELGRTDIYDDREAGMPYTVGNFAIDRPRLPIGYFSLITVGTFVNGTMRLHLYDGITTATITTSAGTIAFLIYTNARFDLADVHVISFNTTSGENDATLVWEPEPAVSTWSDQTSNYIYNPQPIIQNMDGVIVTTQPHLSGRSHGTAYSKTTTTLSSGQQQQLYVISTGPVCNDGGGAAYTNVVNGLSQQPIDSLLDAHVAWWNSYYPETFLTFGNASYIEAFYWIQMYKIASGARKGRDVFDLEGPWFIDGTDWPDLHWDLNLQFLYQVMYTGNRLDSASTLPSLLQNIYPNLITNIPLAWQYDSAAAPTGASALDGIETCYWSYATDPETGNCVTAPPSITGNLLWALHNNYLQYQYSMNSSMLSEIYPILRRAVNFYTHFMINGTDGYIHLPVTYSPEYPVSGPDTNYDLALLRWGVSLLLQLSEQLGQNDTNIPVWKDIQNRLVPYPQTPFIGYNIAEGVPFNMSHRHFSHLFMVWPLMLNNLSDPSELEISTISVDHWISLPDQLTGFARPAVSTMNSHFAAFVAPENVTMRQQAAYSNITFVINTWILANTMYAEGTDGACGETPPAIASAIQDWMLISNDDYIVVFPGIDDGNVVDAAFHLLRACGAYLISSKRENNVTQFVRIVNNASDGVGVGGGVNLHANMQGPWISDPVVEILMTGPNSANINISVGQTVIIYSSVGQPPNLTIQAAPGDPTLFNYWGVHSSSSSSSTQRLVLSECENKNENQVFYRNNSYFHPHDKNDLCLTINSCENFDSLPVVVKKCNSLASATTTTPTCNNNKEWSVESNFIINNNRRCLIVNDRNEIVTGPCSRTEWNFDEKSGNIIMSGSNNCLTVLA